MLVIATGCVTKLHVIFVFSIHLSVSRGAALFDLSKRALLNPVDSACKLYLQHYNIVKGAQLLAAAGDRTGDEKFLAVEGRNGTGNACQLGKR